MPFRVATLYHQTSPTDTRLVTPPEVFAPLTSVDYRNNIDPAMQAILAFMPGTTYKDLTAEVANNPDISIFIGKYRAFKANPKNQFVSTEAETNSLGYRLLKVQRIKDAIEVFKLNVESYPNSANVYDSLGEGYANAGNKDEAIKAYERALKVNPNLANSIDALKRLRGN